MSSEILAESYRNIAIAAIVRRFRLFVQRQLEGRVRAIVPGLPPGDIPGVKILVLYAFALRYPSVATEGMVSDEVYAQTRKVAAEILAGLISG